MRDCHEFQDGAEAGLRRTSAVVAEAAPLRLRTMGHCIHSGTNHLVTLPALPLAWWRHFTWTLYASAGEVRRPDDLQVLHIRRIIEKEMPDTRTLVNAVSR